LSERKQHEILEFLQTHNLLVDKAVEELPYARPNSVMGDNGEPPL